MIGTITIEEQIKEFHGHPLFLKVLDELKQLHSEKNKQYATKDDPLGNFRRCSTSKKKLLNPSFSEDEYRRMSAYAILLASKQEDGACEIIAENKIGTVDSLYEKLRDVVVYYAICMVFEKLREEKDCNTEKKYVGKTKNPSYKCNCGNPYHHDASLASLAAQNIKDVIKNGN